MNEIVIERAALPKQLLEWLEAESEQGQASLLILRKDNGRFILQRVGDANPEVMRIARDASVQYASLLKRLADA